LLLVTLPIKGFAATGMLACGPNHHQMYGAASKHVESAGPAWHDHGDGVSHQHADIQAFASGTEQASPSSDDAISAGHSSHLNAKYGCGTCAPCCASAVLTGDATIPVTASATSADFPVASAAHRSAPVSRLDRPPRLIFA
jgi:hypothetical protein